jgi:hypothetical protein
MDFGRARRGREAVRIGGPILSVAVMFWLVPVAAYAVASIVSIQDGDGSSKAQVDVGKLRVGDGSGSLTVDGGVRVTNDSTAPVKVREVDPIRSPFQAMATITLDNNEATDSTVVFTVPKEKLLVIETAR